MRYNLFKADVCTVRQNIFLLYEMFLKMRKKITMTIETLTEIIANYNKFSRPKDNAHIVRSSERNYPDWNCIFT